jgi:hypothetical protein
MKSIPAAECGHPEATPMSRPLSLLLLSAALSLAAGCGEAPPPKAAVTGPAFEFAEEAFVPDHRALEVRDLVVDRDRVVAVATNRGLYVDAGNGMKSDLPARRSCHLRPRPDEQVGAGTPDGSNPRPASGRSAARPRPRQRRPRGRRRPHLGGDEDRPQDAARRDTIAHQGQGHAARR